MTSPIRWVRAPVVRIIDRGDATTLLGSDGVARRLEGDSAALVRALLSFLWAPRSRDEILAHLAELTGEPISETRAIDDALALLHTTGVIREAGAPARATQPKLGARLVLGLTGAVATMHSPSWVAQLVQRGHDVRVATTRKALRFVRREALESLTHRRVYSSIWQRDDECPVPHINLAEWADVVLICPATATTIARIAQGSCVDLVSALAISTRAPVIVVPSMNPAMYGAPSVQRNLDRLREDGFHLVHPASGIEVAHAPDARTPVFGPAPPFEDVLAILSLVMATRSQSTRAPATAAEWDALYAAGPPGALPWARDDIDGDIATALAETSDARRALEVGTGTGTTAIAMAQRGLNVIATDVSSRALEWARSRPGAESVTWLQDDILASRLQANFDVAVDRGCLHLLPRERHPAYVRAMAQRVRAGGRLILKVHSEAMTDDRKTHRFARDELAALFQPEFEPIRIAPSTLPGPGDHAPPAWLAVFRRL